MIAKSAKNKRQGKSAFFSFVLGFLLLLTIIFLAVNNITVKQRRDKLKSQIEALEAEVNQARKKQEALKNKISQDKNGENIERIARNQLGLKKPGEGVVVVKQKKEENKIEDKEKDKNWWELVKGILGIK